MPARRILMPPIVRALVARGRGTQLPFAARASGARAMSLALAVGALAAPTSAHGQEPTGGTPTPSAPTTETPGLVATPNALLGRIARFRGAFPVADAGRTVSLERFDAAAATWLPVSTATVAADGSFLARWRTDRSGRLQVRAMLVATSEAGAATAAPQVSVTVYRPATATWYGPGLYGRTTACGQRLTRTLLGVAHKRLPCGTLVALSYGDATITVPVVDRGPFRPGTQWDLTSATAQALGFELTGRVGAIALD